MLSFKLENHQRFNYKAAGVTIHNDKVLLHRLEQDNFWTLPGGRCEAMEDTKQTLIREYYEEIGLEVKVERPLFFVENFFELKGESYHELMVVHKVALPANCKELNQPEFYGEEGSQCLVFRWFAVDELFEVNLLPAFLREKLNPLPVAMEHVVVRL